MYRCTLTDMQAPMQQAVSCFATVTISRYHAPVPKQNERGAGVDDSVKTQMTQWN